jgi:hypothetical protein
MENREKEKKHYRTQIFAEKPGFKNLINLRSSASKKVEKFSIFPPSADGSPFSFPYTFSVLIREIRSSYLGMPG